MSRTLVRRAHCTPPLRRLKGHCRTTGAIFAVPRTTSRTTATRAAFPQCSTTVPRDSGENDDFHAPLMHAAPPCDYKRRRRAPFRLSGLSGFSLPRGRSGTTEHSSQPTPLLAETWELPSLSRLTCILCYKHSGCKIIQCPRTPPLLDVRPRGRNQDKLCVTVLPLASTSGTRKHTALLVGSGPPGQDTDKIIFISSSWPTKY